MPAGQTDKVKAVVGHGIGKGRHDIRVHQRLLCIGRKIIAVDKVMER